MHSLGPLHFIAYELFSEVVFSEAHLKCNKYVLFYVCLNSSFSVFSMGSL